MAARIAGIGYKYIRNGRGKSGRRERNSSSPTICIRNCKEMRMTTSAVITSTRRKTQNSAATVPSVSNETFGNRPLGWTLANRRKKFPSVAAAYGTREYPSKREKTDENATQMISTAAVLPAHAPYVACNTVEATKLGAPEAAVLSISCQGTTPSMLMFISR